MTDIERVRELDRLYLQAERSDDPADWAAYHAWRSELRADMGMDDRDDAAEGKAA